MGYYMDQLDADFTIESENIRKVIRAIKALDGAEDEKGANGATYKDGKLASKHYAWVSNNFSKGKRTAQALFSEWRWVVTTDGDEVDSPIIGIQFEGQKLGDDQILFDAIAPYVTPGSYIEMQGEDGARWRWVFDGKTCREVSASVNYDEESSDGYEEKFRALLADVALLAISYNEQFDGNCDPCVSARAVADRLTGIVDKHVR
jgi:hypothetical protein